METDLLRDVHRQPDAAQGETHRWADWIELHCLANEDQLLGFGDVLDLLAGANEPDGDLEAEDFESSTWGEAEGEEVRSTIDRRSRYRPMTTSVFRLLEARAHLFGDAYPFAVEAVPGASGGHLLRVHTEWTNRRRNYLFLLLCALFRYLTKSQEGALAKEFERRSVAAISAITGPKVEVHLFGTAPTAGGRYSGNLLTKLQRLVGDLKESFAPKFKAPSPYDTGDAGLDIVAWLPIDEEAGTVVLFGQAACTPNWVTKQHSASPTTWSNKITMMAPQSVTCCIPFCFRDTHGKWHDPGDIHGSVLLDRSRLLKLLMDDPAPSTAELGAAAEVFNYLISANHSPPTASASLLGRRPAPIPG